ncbi:FAD-binding oxidoreductase [Tropicibacter oceani]|uniref:FAD-binding oxidoreductase n=1 Tax=Tropicibacter oceani TaxID=3058420 RepID=A0ABY8QFX0_9RHOB|nr:FAD-binding oxidoreductase [Tropicibacter oceani]WGW03502.1 FAD-binding oxidoreductase [Tropicibacter oceani]
MPLCPADDSFAQTLGAALPPDTLRPAEARHLEDPRGRWSSSATHVALPRSVQEVAAIVRACNDARVGLTPIGGGTGLVGGQIPREGPAPLLLSLERMNAMRAAFPEEYALVAEAGCILADVQSAAEQVNRLFPLSLASEGSARIGGLLSTNAGGVNTLRYGNARDLVLGLEAVLPDGQVWNGLKRLRKDNTGYDLRHLLIGAEGTLGVITAASLKLFPRPAATGTALLTVTDPQAALSLLTLAKGQIGDGISAFELLHRTGFDFLRATLPEIRQPWPIAPEWCVLIELGLSQGQNPQDALERLFAEAHEAGLVHDGLVAHSLQQARDFWTLREHIPEANKRIGSIASHDISLPLGAIPAFITKATQALAGIGDWRINCFGHLGDGNLHFNVFAPEGVSKDSLKARSAEVTALVHDLTHAMDGSVSAEHGIGRHKVADLEKYGDPAKLAAMRAIKSALDPRGIMNPGAVLRA